MIVTMYKGSSKCIADKDQVPVMINAGWSMTKTVEKPVKKVAPVAKVEKAKVVVETPVVKATKEVAEPTEAAPKKAGVAPKKKARVAPPRKRRSSKKE